MWKSRRCRSNVMHYGNCSSREDGVNHGQDDGCELEQQELVPQDKIVTVLCQARTGITRPYKPNREPYTRSRPSLLWLVARLIHLRSCSSPQRPVAKAGFTIEPGHFNSFIRLCALAAKAMLWLSPNTKRLQCVLYLRLPFIGLCRCQQGALGHRLQSAVLVATSLR